MRLRPVILTGLALAAVPSSAHADSSGGVAAPVELHSLKASVFSISPGSVMLGTPVQIAWRVDGPARAVRARVLLTPAAGGRAVTLQLGIRRTGRQWARTFTPTARRLAPGAYVARLRATKGVRRTSVSAPLQVVAPPPPAAVSGVFPVQGDYDFGGPDARFGASRDGHVHQGQDVMAPEGTPVVTPVGGTVFWSDYQASGAGYYVVIHGDDGRDYAFMHFQKGSVVVAKGQAVVAGQRLASVGHTGDAQGSHLHFEIWPDGWYATRASKPVDPLPDLQAWAASA
jgi:murein DD-endopeptidase MepM/ murein hydrolase activator NlpD